VPYFFVGGFTVVVKVGKLLDVTCLFFCLLRINKLDKAQ